MDQSCEAEAPLQFYEYVDLQICLSPPKMGVLLAGEDLLRAAGHSPGSKRPKGWSERVDGFGRRTEDGKYTLRVSKDKNGLWYVRRQTSRRLLDFEFLAFGFGEVPLCTRSADEAMRLADHFYPNPGLTIGGCWVRWPNC
jgi:hypothetical protein